MYFITQYDLAFLLLPYTHYTKVFEGYSNYFISSIEVPHLLNTFFSNHTYVPTLDIPERPVLTGHKESCGVGRRPTASGAVTSL